MNDVVKIGTATLYLGDCRDIIPSIEKIYAVVTDPPYGMNFQSNHRKEKHLKIADDHDESLLLWACELPAVHSKYIFCRWDNLWSVPKPKSLITWVKDNHSMGDLKHEHGRQTEVALFYPGEKHSFPGKRPNDVIKAARTGNNFHPTEKPVGLMEVVCGWTAGTIFDPFMGSGSTGVAAIHAGRQFIGVEREKKYFDIACERISRSVDQIRMF